ncbi:MAG: DUF2339 domain-containing protein [Pseudomonadota bacterium]
MEGLLVLLGLVVLAIPIAVVVLLIGFSNLRARVTQLEKTVARMSADALREDRRASDTSAEVPPEPKAPDPKTTAPSDTDQPAAARVIAERRSADDQKAAKPAAAATRSQPPAKPPEPREPGLPGRFLAWLSVNWFYAVSAISLALAGLFLVQYGVENGYLPPTARVLAALAFGAALIGAGEVIRRRFGDDESTTTAYLPSVFSGAGLVSLFGGVTAARLLYGLIGVEAAFAGLAAVGLLGVVLGWFYGPLLAAVGVVGAFGAPFLVDSPDPATAWLFVYFAIVAALGLGIDTIRRWAWVSGLSVGLAFVTGFLTVLSAGGTGLDMGFQLYVAGVAVLAILVPARSLWPDHDGPLIAEFAVRQNRLPGFPTLLAAAALVAASAFLALAGTNGADQFWTAVTLLALLATALTVWSVRGPALQDLAVLPVLALAALVAQEGGDRGGVYAAFRTTYADTPEADFPMQVSILWAVGLVLSAIAAGRALRPGYGLAWGIAAATIAPALAILLEVTWAPADTIGAYPWALHAIVLAAVMVALALRFARVDGTDMTRVSVFVLSALASISFALVLILSSVALTVALAVTVVVAAALDRRFDLPLMQIFINIGVVTVGARLIADPGLFWALDAPFWEMLLAYGGALAAFVAALWLLRGRNRPSAMVMLDTAAWSTGGTLLSLILFHVLDNWLSANDVVSHWSMGLYAVIWLGLMVTQLIRLEQLGGWLRLVRVALAAVFGLIGLGALGLALTVFNPLLTDWAGDVEGVILLNTLIIAYLLPAAVLAFGVWRLRQPLLRIALAAVATGLAGFWAFAALRHAFQGASRMELRFGFTQPELWSYTVALLIVGAVLFYQSLANGSAIVRKAGLVVIGLAVAKVFLIDISDLSGLTRVLSLVVLGLSLAGLAWLNRWAQEQAAPEPGEKT